MDRHVVAALFDGVAHEVREGSLDDAAGAARYALKKLNKLILGESSSSCEIYGSGNTVVQCTPESVVYVNGKRITRDE